MTFAPALAVVLTAQQRAAATAKAPHLLVLAGPGAGKTATLVARFHHLCSIGVPSARICALTFGRKAAESMRSRVAEGLAPGAVVAASTFHSFCMGSALRRDPAGFGLPAAFKVLSKDRDRSAIFTSRGLFWNDDVPILDVIDAAKDRMLDAAAFAREAASGAPWRRRAVPFFQAYEEALQAQGAVDFSDMVLLVARRLAADPLYATAFCGSFDHLLVDEYQDVNPAQVALLKAFAAAGVAIWAVGDDDQTLYGFRAADVANVVRFADAFPGAVTRILSMNHRSAAPLVEAAGRLISHNLHRVAKPVDLALDATVRQAQIVIRGYPDAATEATAVAYAVRSLIRDGLEPSRIAVLFRTSAVGSGMMPAFTAAGIPIEVRGGADLWGGLKGRLALGTLRAFRDGDTAAVRAILGSTWRTVPLLDEVRRSRAAVGADVAEQVARVRRALLALHARGACAREVAEWRSGIEAVMRWLEGCASLEAAEKLVREQSKAFLEPPTAAVAFSTVHAAKGLEFEAVFVAGWEDGVLPSSLSLDLEEERRIAFVAVTRARRILGLTYALRRDGPASPSRFLREIAGPSREGALVWTGDRADDTVTPPLLTGHESRRARMPLRETAAVPLAFS